MFIIASLIFLGVLFTTLWQLGLMNPSYIIISLLIIAFYMAIYLIDRKRENDKLTKLVSRLKEFNEGVLGQVFDDIKGGIVGNLSQEIANVTQNTRHLVGELSIASEQLKELCQKFYSETDASAKSSQEIAETISHIAERTEDQVSACSDAVTEIVKLSDLSNLIASETAKVVSGNIEVQKSLQESSQLIEKLVNSIELTSQQNSVTAVEVDALVKEAEKVRKEKAAEYAALQSSAEAAAKRGYVDSIIEPETVRKHAIYSFEMLFTKRESRPSKKHGTV